VPAHPELWDGVPPRGAFREDFSTIVRGQQVASDLKGEDKMKVSIICFSQTGGTEKIARMIQKGIIKGGDECELVGMKDADAKKVSEVDLIGIGCPTFFYREPGNVTKFIDELDENPGKHCFLFCTHGSQIGNTFYFMSEGLKKRGYLVIGSYDSYSDSSIQFYPEVMHTAHHPDDIELEEAKKFGEEICGVSTSVQQGKSELLPRFELIEDTWWAQQTKMLTPELLREISPAFQINTDKCVQCLTCQDNCPGNVINVQAEPPEIQNEGCVFCWYCEKACPEGATEADWTDMRRNSCYNLQRYVEILKEAEKEGKFRPYVDYEKIL